MLIAQSSIAPSSHKIQLKRKQNTVIPFDAFVSSALIYLVTNEYCMTSLIRGSIQAGLVMWEQ